MANKPMTKKLEDVRDAVSRMLVAGAFHFALKLVSTYYTGKATLHVYNGDWTPTLLIEGALLGWWIQADAKAGSQTRERLLDAVGLLALFGAVLVIGWEDTGWLAVFPRLAFGLLLWRSVASAWRDYQAYRAAQWYTAIQRGDKRAERQLDSERARFRRELVRQRAEVERDAGREALKLLGPDFQREAVTRLRREWFGVPALVGEADSAPPSDNLGARAEPEQFDLDGWLADAPKSQNGANGS